MPFKDYEYTFKKGKNEKTDKVINYVMFESLKQPNKSKQFVDTCLTYLDEMITLANQSNSDEFDVIKVGTMIKNLNECFMPCMQLAIAKQYYDEVLSDGSNIDEEELQAYNKKYEDFYQLIKDHKIENANKMKPLLTGKDIMKLYDIQGGPILQKLTCMVFNWQLEHPSGTSDDIEKYLIDNKDKLLSS